MRSMPSNVLDALCVLEVHETPKLVEGGKIAPVAGRLKLPLVVLTSSVTVYYVTSCMRCHQRHRCESVTQAYGEEAKEELPSHPLLRTCMSLFTPLEISPSLKIHTIAAPFTLPPLTSTVLRAASEIGYNAVGNRRGCGCGFLKGI